MGCFQYGVVADQRFSLHFKTVLWLWQINFVVDIRLDRCARTDGDGRLLEIAMVDRCRLLIRTLGEIRGAIAGRFERHEDTIGG